MSWWKRLFHSKDRKRPPSPAELHFNDPAEALEYACAYLQCDLIEGATLPCIIEDVEQGIASIALAAKDSPVRTIAAFANDVQYPALYIGSLCAALVGPVVNDAPRPMLLIAQLKPSYGPRGWAIERPLR